MQISMSRKLPNLEKTITKNETFPRFAPENLASCDFWWCYGILTLWGISIVSLTWNVRVCKCELVSLAQSRWGSPPCIRSKKPREAWFQRFNHFWCELWRPEHPPNIPTKWTKPTLDLGELSPDQIRSLYEHMKPYQSCQLREMSLFANASFLLLHNLDRVVVPDIVQRNQARLDAEDLITCHVSSWGGQ